MYFSHSAQFLLKKRKNVSHIDFFFLLFVERIVLFAPSTPLDPHLCGVSVFCTQALGCKVDRYRRPMCNSNVLEKISSGKSLTSGDLQELVQIWCGDVLILSLGEQALVCVLQLSGTDIQATYFVVMYIFATAWVSLINSNCCNSII